MAYEVLQVLIAFSLKTETKNSQNVMLLPYNAIILHGFIPKA